MKTASPALALAFTLAMACAAPAAERLHDVELANGERVRAILIPASACPVVVQTAEWCLEVPLDRIVRIDGSTDVAAALRDADREPLLHQETFEDLRADGSVLLRASFARTNLSAAATAALDWGLAPHEMARLDHWKVYDEFGNELTMRVEPRADGGGRATVPLVRPVLPGETVRFTSEILFPEQLRREGDALVYRHEGDYPDDRVVARMLRLPEGATLVSSAPDDAQVLKVDGRTFVYWRRYFTAGERTAFEVKFRPAG